MRDSAQFETDLREAGALAAKIQENFKGLQL
jgi:hypothetical protein